MTRLAFVSDRHASLQVNHSFGGLLLNRIPGVRKLKWRLVGTAQILCGGMGQRNIALNPGEFDAQGAVVRPFSTLGRTPHVEVGYGIENIFKFIRIDALHRLTYCNRPDINTFGVKVSTQFTL